MIKLQILAEDIKNSRYTRSEDCAITRAITRGGLKGYRHTGMEIRSNHSSYQKQTDLYSDSNSNLKELADRVWRMYRGIDKVEDFEFTLITKENDNLRTARTEPSDNQGVHETQ